MADSRGFHTHRTEAEDDLSRAWTAFNNVDIGTLSPAELIGYAQARATMGVAHALLAQVALEDQPPLPR
ncbi:hypothetical protein A5731_28060 [Mycolicibacterium conceptionense]|jgi:hypothetical protein|uniref:Uncharacterized protein n=2 Tax=Mycolicibacterium TaxID=1866885 RepID=A0A0J8U0H4_9MYCO|nr:hypothetical protein AA982_31445 [Mycolicibacterium senegalense]KMV14045.1 hypothetical protein ACT17_32095 [Mycolicibacterium conceptionense]ORW50993.1 hypothetical protein AWC21_32205 [Mycolicibacterium peregrinum]KLO50447.1 hypothetical protein ABW05_01880 [Mycolicibacterium senegalense]OBB08760.1 hypothetical protein A5718_13075 [Mycolicibacterium conceptionense]